MKLDEDSERGYILEVDLEIPKDKHDFLDGLSLHINHLIAWHMGISFWQFGILPIGIFLSNLDSRHLMTYPRTLLGQF